MAAVDCTSRTSELAELETLLTAGRVPLGFFNLSSLDGFLATVLVGPVWMPPEVWLPLVWNGTEPEWLDQDEAARVCGTVLSRHDEVARQLADDPDSYAPIFRTLPDGTVAADEWARGFQAGMGLHSREWDALDKDPGAKRFLVTITAQLPDWDGKIMAELGQEAVLAFRRQGRDFIGYTVAQIQRFWATWRQASQTRRHGHRHGQPALN
jgi:yecA family protein